MVKKSTLIIAAWAVIALCLANPAFPDAVPSSIVPGNAQWLVHLDMEKFVATELYGGLVKKDRFEIKSRNFNRWFKMDIPKDVTGITVFGLGSGDKDIVFAVTGRLDKAGIIALAEADKDSQKTSYGAYTLFSTGSDEHGAFINDGLLVFSEGREAIEKALDTAGGKAKNFSGTQLEASLKGVPAGAFLCGVLPDLSRLGKEFGQSKVLDKASGLFFLAQEKKELLLVRLQVTAKSPESAKNMADVVQGLIAMGRLGGNEGNMAKAASLLDGLQIKLDGQVLRIDFERPSKEIAELLSSHKSLGVE